MYKIELLAEYPIVFSIVDLELDIGWDAGFALRQRASTLCRKEWENLTIVAGWGSDRCRQRERMGASVLDRL